MAKTAVKEKKQGRQAEKRGSALHRAADFKNSRDIPYHPVVVSCACGAEFEAGSVLEAIRVDICSKCHPFFTGESRIIDAEGRVDKFRKRYGITAK